MDEEQFRGFVRSLPDVCEGTHEGLAVFKVGDRRFATLGWPEPHMMAMALTQEDAALALDSFPVAVERAPGAWGRRGHIHLNLTKADDATVRSLTTMAWQRCVRL